MMLIVTLKKLGKRKLDLISINMKITNFASDMITTIKVLVVNITVGLKSLSLAFFVVYAKSIYFVLLERDQIHFSHSFFSTLHQLLMF